MDLQKDETKVYRFGDCLVAPCPSESLLAAGYLRLESEGTIQAIFHESDESPGVMWFLKEFCENKQSILTCWLKSTDQDSNGQDQWEHAGFLWFSKKVPIGAGYSRTEAAMGFFKKYQRRNWTLIWGALGTEWVFDQIQVDTLFGVTPTPNRAASLWFRGLCYESSSPISQYSTYNGKLCDCYISWMTESRWAELDWFTKYGRRQQRIEGGTAECGGTE